MAVVLGTSCARPSWTASKRALERASEMMSKRALERASEMMCRARALVACAVALWVLFVAPSQATAAPILTPVASVAAPVYVTHAGDGRIFIVNQAGQIRIYQPGSGLRTTPFLDIQSKVSSGGERGLLSMAFHPDYASNGFFYVDYTNLQGNTVIERYHVSADPNLADASSPATLLVIAQPFANHNGGQLQVGPSDGYLYIGMGDGGSGGDPQCNGQRLDTLLGKILRLNIRVNQNVAPYYGIPPSNPFVGAGDPSGNVPDEIWAYGLRNPWRFSFDRSSGDLYIADVGQNAYEEIDFVRAGTAGGLNFGWNAMEGLHCYAGGACGATCNAPNLALPVYEYSHNAGDCSVTGGYVYRGTRVPELRGRYVYGDYCSGALRTLMQGPSGTWQSADFLTVSSGPMSFGEDASGELYVAVAGTVYRIDSDTPIAAVPALGKSRLIWLWFGILLLALARKMGTRRARGDGSVRAPRFV